MSKLFIITPVSPLVLREDVNSEDLYHAIDAYRDNFDLKEIVWLWGSLQTEGTMVTGDVSYCPVYVDTDVVAGHQRFCQNGIRPIFNYFPSHAEFIAADYQAYRAFNQALCDKLLEYAGEGDYVWIHDYQLMLMPALITAIGLNIHTGFFFHSPFPSYELLKQMPAEWRNELLASVANSSLVGLQTAEFVRHYLLASGYFLKTDEATLRTAVKHYPTSVAYKKIEQAYNNAAVDETRTSIRRRSGRCRIIFTIDTLDYTSGMLGRLQAFEDLLKEHPELRRKVVMIFNAVPGEEDDFKYSERRRLIEILISRINGLYGSMKWQPVIYLHAKLSEAQRVGYYTACDVGLMTPFRDGMCFYAKEFVAARADGGGALILSEFAGAAEELTDALLVNPHDNELMAKALYTAITADATELAASMGRMRETLRRSDSAVWYDRFLGDLLKAPVADYAAEAIN
jgi:trehalose 6-phosphate synthase/phosphatase